MQYKQNYKHNEYNQLNYEFLNDDKVVALATQDSRHKKMANVTTLTANYTN